MKIGLTLVFIFLVSLFNVVAEDQRITYTMYIYDEPKSYIVNGESYTVQVLSVDGYNSRSIFSINGDKKIIKLNEAVTIANGVQFRVDEIVEVLGNERTTFSFIVSNSCGNNLCDDEETCSSCSKDCGCDKGHECVKNKCTEQIICGDSKCSTAETCNEDSCCDGMILDLKSDKINCGSCGNVCSKNQNCISGNCINLTDYCGDGVCSSNENCGLCANDCSCNIHEKCEFNKCVNYCGNDICEENEDYLTCSKDCKKTMLCGDGTCESGENCCKDCGCGNGLKCTGNSCIPIYECTSNSDCRMNETCTDNRCELSQQESTNTLVSTSKIESTNTSGYGNSEGIQGNKEEGVIEDIINWFLSWFR